MRIHPSNTVPRRTEASLLKVSDIDSQGMVIHIHRGKGLRDRDVPLTPKLLEKSHDRRILTRGKLHHYGKHGSGSV
jgi:integrase